MRKGGSKSSEESARASGKVSAQAPQAAAWVGLEVDQPRKAGCSGGKEEAPAKGGARSNVPAAVERPGVRRMLPVVGRGRCERVWRFPMTVPVENLPPAAGKAAAGSGPAAGFQQRVIHAGLWSAAARIAGEGSRYVIAIVLARLLSPAEFGLIALATALMGLVQAFADLRVSYALIQRPRVSEEEWSTVFWMATGMGAVLTLAFAACAGLIAEFYANPALREIVWALSVSFLLSAVALTPRTKLEKDLRFKALSLAQIVATVGTGLLAIGMAVAGFGVWSLVAQSLAVYALDVGFLFWYTRWRPRWVFQPAALRPLLRFSAPLVLHDVLNTLAQSTDRLILGKMVSAADLGLYNRAKIFLYLPVANLSFSMTRVMFPSLSALQGDPERVQRAALRMLKLLAVVSFPLMTIAAALAEPLVRVVLGPKWLAAVPMMRIFALAGILASINAVATTILMAKGKTTLVLQLGVAKQIASVAGVALGAFWGATGCAFGVLAVTVVIFVLDAYSISRALGVRLVAYWGNLTTPLILALLAGGSGWAAVHLLGLGTPPLGALLAALPISILSYGLLLFAADRAGFEGIIRLGKELQLNKFNSEPCSAPATPTGR